MTSIAKYPAFNQGQAAPAGQQPRKAQPQPMAPRPAAQIQQPQQDESPSWVPPQDNRELWRQATQFGVHTRGPGWMEGSPQDPRNWSAEQREDYVNRVRNAQKAQEAKFGGKYNADGYFVRDKPQQAAEAQPESPWGQPGQSPWAQAPSRDFNYQPAFNAQGQAVNSANVMGRLAAESRYTPNAGSADGNRATSDLAKSMLMENAAHGRRGLEATNAEQNMKEQAARSEAMQQALGNQTRMYSDATNRATDQLSLASQIQQAMMESRNRFRQAMMGS
jgi:hypothetical protein